MLVKGLNLIRDFWSTLNDAAELGTGTTQETAEDTDLETVVAGSESTTITTNNTPDQFLTKAARFPGTSAGGQSVAEIIWKTQSPEKAGSRITFPATIWNTTSEINITTRYYFKGRKGE